MSKVDYKFILTVEDESQNSKAVLGKIVRALDTVGYDYLNIKETSGENLNSQQHTHDAIAKIKNVLDCVFCDPTDMLNRISNIVEQQQHK